MSEYIEAKIYRTKMPYEPRTKQPFGITKWARVNIGGAILHIRTYQGVSGDLERIEVET